MDGGGGGGPSMDVGVRWRQTMSIALAPRCEAANWIAIESCNIFNDWRRDHELWSSGHPKTMGSLSN